MAWQKAKTALREKGAAKKEGTTTKYNTLAASCAKQQIKTCQILRTAPCDDPVKHVNFASDALLPRSTPTGWGTKKGMHANSLTTTLAIHILPL